MSDYLESRSDNDLDLLIRRSEAAEKLTPQQQIHYETAKRILAKRSAGKVAPHFDLSKAINFLSKVAKEQRLCSYKELVTACVNDPSVEWTKIYRKIGGNGGLMQSIIRHCAANDLPQFSSLVVRESEVLAGPYVPPDREGEAEYGFKRGMVAEGLAKQTEETDFFIIQHRKDCFSWAAIAVK